jgi:2-hydroxycyclohexanecarboxyl-CoA dehydrogenase
VALVTGAAQGIGRATALRLAADGLRVVVNDIRPVADLAREIGGLAVQADVSDRAAVDEMVAAVERDVGPVSVLVSNAAAMTMAPFVEAEEADWWRQVDVNLTGTFNVVQSALVGMRRLGAGRIVVIASEWGVTGWPCATGYAASKAGLIALVKTLGRELAPEGIIVNAIAPGVVDTPQLEVDAQAANVSVDTIRSRYAAATPLLRIGRPEEIAATVSFLASPDAGALVGQVLQPNGGTTR